MNHADSPRDKKTAEAFAHSWNHLPEGSVYTPEQFADWMHPLGPTDFKESRVLELGCGNGSLLIHSLAWEPDHLTGVDLGDSVVSARANLKKTGQTCWEVVQADLIEYAGPTADVTYCIGVLHHLETPESGFDSVVRNTRPGGKFHCWVYAHEGNAPVRLLVEPLRHLCCRLPWWLTKYGFATPLALPVFIYAQASRLLPDPWTERLPLGAYMIWIRKRGWKFVRHVVFDQLVTPRTVYIRKSTIESWLGSRTEIDPDSVYIIARNGNSWKFGGRRKVSK